MKTIVRGAPGTSLAAVGLGTGARLADPHSKLFDVAWGAGVAAVPGVTAAGHVWQARLAARGYPSKLRAIERADPLGKKPARAAAALFIDRAVLGWNYPGYYVTINFISSTATTLFGAWAAVTVPRQGDFAPAPPSAHFYRRHPKPTEKRF